VAVASGAATLEPPAWSWRRPALAGKAQRIDDVVASGASMIESPTGPPCPMSASFLGG